MSSYKETWDLTTSVMRLGALLIGVACVLQNSALIGEPPEDPSLGVGVLLYTLSIGFFIAYAMFWVGITAVGLFVMRWPIQWAMRLLGLPYLEIAVLQGFGGALLVLIRRRQNFQSSGLSVTRDKRDTDMSEGKLRRVFGLVMALWIVWPFFAMPNNETFSDAAFRIAQIRKDHAVVHVRSPWDKRLAQSGLKASASFLGADFARFDDVTVLRRSIGRRVVLRVSASSGKPEIIGVPRDYVEVE